MYYEAGGLDIDTGLDIDFSWDGGGAGFTAAETFEFDINLPGLGAFDVRWGDFVGAAASVTANTVEGLVAINVVSGTGILNSQADGVPFDDSGYDTAADAFLVGSLDWEFDFADGGTSNLVIDNALVVNEGQDIGATFKGLTIVGVPEPTTAMLFSIVLIRLCCRRLRKPMP